MTRELTFAQLSKDRNLIALSELMIDCSMNHGSCNQCPMYPRCLKWYDGMLSKYPGYLMKDAEYEKRLAEFGKMKRSRKR